MSLYDVPDFKLSSRVFKLDAQAIDSFYHECINQQFSEGGLMKFLVRIGIFTIHLWKTIWTNQDTPGNILYNLRYAPSSTKQKFLHFIFHLVRISFKFLEEKGGLPGKIWTTAVFVNWILFLLTGRYRNVPQRLSGIHLDLIDPKKKLEVDYQYSNRLLFMKVFNQTLRLALPYVHIESFIGFFIGEIDTSLQTNWECVICGHEAVSPKATCQHLICYYCGYDQPCPKCET